MTYDALIDKIRLKAMRLLKLDQLMSPVVFDAINDVLRETSNNTRLTTKQAPLSIVAGTSTYTISTAIATDVGEIYQIQLSTGEIIGKSVSEFEEIKQRDVLSETETSTATGSPIYYKVWNAVSGTLPSTLTLYPIPSTSCTATVYFFPRIVSGLYTVAIGITTFPLEDEFITPVSYLALAILFEQAGDEKRAMYYRGIGQESLDDVKRCSPKNDGVSEITFHDPIFG